jgi:integrase/recombinase XerD
MSPLRRHLADYLRLRRALGFKLERAGRLLDDFVTFVERAGAEIVTIELALGWATLPQSAEPVWLAQRLGVVRGFARYLHTVDPRTEVPPSDLVPGRYQRVSPYLYSDDDIAALMDAARSFRPALRSATYETLIGLLAVTGMRVGEAMRLDRDDVDWTGGLVTIRASKFGKTMALPLHESTLGALKDYGARRDRLCPYPQSPSFFVSSVGTRLGHSHVQPAFRIIRRHAGLGRPTPGRPATIHGLRHSFAVKTVLGWYRAGLDVAARMPLLSTYLGHADPARTYWYLSAAPELLALAAQRLEQRAGASS